MRKLERKVIKTSNNIVFAKFDIGVIIFSDPQQVAVEGTGPASVYPHTFFLPRSGVQRGTVYLSEGDPLSPTWPSVEGAYRSPGNIFTYSQWQSVNVDFS